ncbi:hypothetical protein PHYBOEH_008319 [Phytophthora boehmeriae]|uniref:SAC domain-containing protein n=1 Tax=Phytophthora boehmeriae TaxID=109152 RepID=A0A8T1W556_9STRA|nr:hypothetical protein PHYBOEH_008319 [Phytophthora boehmeriae]
MSISGPLYRRTPRLFSPSKPGEWSIVWCNLSLERGELLVALDPDGRSRIASIPVKDCELAHVRSDGRDCIELTITRGKKETFSSHESSHDVDWWMTTLITVKRDLQRGVKPHIPIVTPPAAEPTTRPKHLRRPSSNFTINLNLGNNNSTSGNSLSGLGRPTLRRRKPVLATCETLFERFTIYETPSTYYVVCSDRHYTSFRMFELDRMVDRPNKLEQVLKEDKRVYDWEQMEARLQSLAELARVRGTGNLIRAFTAVAIVGCIRFLRGYYFIFVTQRRKIGCIGGNSIYGISATQQLNLSPPEEGLTAWSRLNRWFNPSPEEEAEARYLGLFHFLDLTKDFYFSYSYDITHTLQHNMTTEHSGPAEMFTWNSYLTQELRKCLSGPAAGDLIVPLVLGCYEQRKCSVFGRLVSIVLLARRSRHFAGTRYLKRGVADTGKAANDVETEQIIEDESMGPGKFSSFVQHRGSIPVFWSQETSATLPKPPIVLNRVDPTYNATQKHFADLFSRYGSPIVALNLVKQSEKKEREVIVGNEYMNAVEYLNSFMPPKHLRNGTGACENVRRNIAFHAENKRKAFGEFYEMPPMHLSCCSSSEISDDVGDRTDNSDDEKSEHEQVVVMATRDQAKRDAYIRECRRVLDDWWREPLDMFERPKYFLPPVEEKGPCACEMVVGKDEVISASSGKSNGITSQGGEQDGLGNIRKLGPPCSDDFLQMYHPEELTTFDKVLGYKFMAPMEISDEVTDKEKPRSDSAVVAHLTSAPSSSSLAPVDEENLSEFEQTSRRGQTKRGSRSVRSMSAPDIGEEIGYPPPSNRRSRDSTREHSKNNYQEDYMSISGSESRRASRSALAEVISKYGGTHGPAELKAVIKRKDDQISIEDYMLGRGRRKFVGDCSTLTPDPVYQQYVLGKTSPQIWENDNESVKMYFDAYMRDNNISPDDSRSLRDAQIRGGATFKLQAGPYSGLDQNVKARVLVAKKLKTEPEDRKIFEESLNLKKLVKTGDSSVPAESLELYKTFFDEELPDVEIYRATKPTPPIIDDLSPPINKRSTSASALSSELAKSIKRLSQHKKGRTRFSGGDLISVGPLFKMDGGKDRDFIVFNEAAAENSFGEVTQNETELSFYSK